MSWIAVTAAMNAAPVGEWRPISREDHSKQWAYKNHAVYSFLNDLPNTALGDGIDGVWHVLEA
jgi:predicted lipoprotein with Yx(FWY)xxD motif